MPTYEFACPRGHVFAERRLFAEMDDPATCPDHAVQGTRMFSANGNIQIPIHFRQLRSNGVPGGGGLSWSDFHDESEAELAKDPRIEKAERVASGPGRNPGKQ